MTGEVKDFGLEPVTLMAALASDIRWQALLLMASGKAISATELAAKVNRDVDSAGKHLRVLKAAGAADWRCAPGDSRCTLYFIPDKFRPEPGILDYGFCKFHLPETVSPTAKD